MSFLKLAVSAALAIATVGTLALPASPAEAQRDWRGRHWCRDGHGHRRVNGRDCRWRRDWRNRNGARPGAVCHDVWRNGYRIPVCRN